MKFNIFVSAVFVAFFGGCAAINSNLDYEVQDSFIDENETYEIAQDWYKGYNQPYLNALVDEALAKNHDLRAAALNLERAYANLGLSKEDLFPTLGASWGAGANRDISRSDEWSKTYSSGFNVSYELDLFGRIRSNINASEWDASASVFDLQNARLTLINSVVSGYFEMLYLNDALKWTKQNLKDYAQIEQIVKAKYDYGRSELIEYKQVQNSILNLKNRVLEIEKNIEDNRKFMRDLISPDLEFRADLPSIESVKFLGADLSVPYTALHNRPDIRAAISRLNAAFYDHKRARLNFFPRVNLGAGLNSANTDKFSDGFDLKFLSGNVSISLPFLDYGRLKSQLRIAEVDFYAYRNSYEKTLSGAVNETLNLYRIYEINRARLANLADTYKTASEIERIYRVKYDAGASELKDFLEARSSAISARINLLAQRYASMQNEISIYRAMAGKFRQKF
ncbi:MULTISPECIES: TolC family protein [unclassified Campylobacter]|uniref:TolC family protein n=1 Tax=unclassified Campylobacter TaxID=2593542 RepID=UPI0022E9FD95|nr:MULTISPECIES: TolC family protein [unclassified Campylobacter]MDA3042558.1 TolC family protein [Campylobacter sp. JMF_09 ED2]MDA3044628.1 TolC family protein [Campylobacter sp. JMF_07 ED4]MDA3071605.1 TolC family protein [Campylobacter sp. VBCF_03 NA9]MDA3074331.1 TolC family protein [Campylobacter sp. JMF_05 ED3]